MKNIYWLCCMLFSFHSFGQINSNYQAVIEKEIQKWVNIHRSTKGFTDLKSSNLLAQPAQIHSDYMAEHDLLSHEENIAKYATPFARVESVFKGTFEVVGENILKIPLPAKMDKDIAKQLGREMFDLWRNSPLHYANIMNPKYEEVAYAFNISETGYIYATQLFGRKGYQFPMRFTDNAYGVETRNSDECYCNLKAYEYDNISKGWGNGISLVGDSVFLFVNDIHMFKEVIVGDKDGLALDVILEEQFKCFENNKLDHHFVYDGLMLPPRFKNDLLKDNRALNPNKLITFLGVIPKAFVNKKISFSLILLNENKLCQYIIPIEIINQEMDLLEIEPKLSPPIVKLKDQSVAMLALDYVFDHNENQVNIPEIILPEGVDVDKIEILSFSSIDGSSEYNEDLALKRGESLKKSLTLLLKVKSSKINIIAKENWELMYYQIKRFYAKKGQLKNFTISDIKNMVKTNDSLPWSLWLDEQRTSKINIYYRFKNSHAPNMELSSLSAALSKKIVGEVEAALYQLYHKASLNYQDLLALESEDLFYYCKAHPILIGNYMAVLNKFGSRNFTLSKILDIANLAENLNGNSRFNILLNYSELVRNWLLVWDLESRILLKMIHPQTIAKIQNGLNEPRLNVNILLNNLNYYYHLLDYKNGHETYEKLSAYYENNLKEAQELGRLAQFYNHWSTFDRTRSLYISHKSTLWEHEDGMFAIMSAYALEDHKSYSFKEVSLQASRLNLKRWCEYFKSNRQLLRNEEVKEQYCNQCDD